MQKMTILCTGKLKEKFYLDAAAEYVKRLSRFCKLEIIELPEERLPEDPSTHMAITRQPLGSLARTASPKAPATSSFSSAAPSECTNP